jgi:Tol biopolymer transport system component
MTGSRFLRGVIAVAAAAAVGGAAAGAGGSAAGASGRIFFSSNRAANLNSELFSIATDGSGRRQLTQPTDLLDQASLSPDGTQIVGHTRGGLEILNADGSSPRALTSNPTDGFPRWSPDGKQVAYLSGSDGSVNVVAATGGSPIRLDSALTWVPPAWSPDSSEVAYTSYEDGPPSIYVAAADGSSIRGLVETGWPTPSTLQWSTDGKIVYDANGHVYSDAADGSGVPVQLTDSSSGNPLLSRDGSRIAYTDLRNGRQELWIMNADGSGQRFVTGDAATYFGASWSPDDKQIAAVRWDASNTQQILLVAADGSNEAVLTDEPSSTAITSAPSWAADGSVLYYTAWLQNSDRELYSMLPDGKGLQQVTHNNVDDADPALSPDGRYLAFDRGAAGQQQLYVMGAGGGGVRQVTHSRFVSNVEPTWSPDGTELAFASNRSGTFHIYRLDLATGRVRKLTGGTAFDRQPSWSGDGSWIAFTSTAYSDVGQSSQVWAIRPNGRGQHRVDAATSAFAPSWSPRGGRLAYSVGIQQTGTTAVFVQNANGTDRMNVASGVGISHPTWDPNASTLVYSTGSDFYRVPADGSAAPQLLSAGVGSSDEPSWQSRCTIRGTAGNDVLVGTPGADTICGFAGNDRIDGRGGNDLLLGGDGNDTLTGGSGSDLVFGGRGNDVLRGRDGLHDVLDGGPGRDRITGDGRDTVR